jgi:hypothetical protein
MNAPEYQGQNRRQGKQAFMRYSGFRCHKSPDTKRNRNSPTDDECRLYNVRWVSVMDRALFACEEGQICGYMASIVSRAQEILANQW